ncbi:MAG TPA: hypothetical protein PK581_09220, partial [Caldisericia bacterium]|nr:hypothetical protein [Caldisericia bacterium]
MKKALSCLVVILMAASILQVGLTTTPVKAAENKNGTFLAVRFVPVGFDRDGKELDGNRDFPWQRTGERVWGRVGYPMPDSLTAVGSPFPGVDANGRGFYPQINIPAKSFDASNPNDIPTDTVPLFWTDFYLDVNPAGGRSQQTERWYAVYDSAGQLWFDADGRFNDARYYEPADPHNMNGIYISESCKNNPLARVDPNTGNNTQGPYILNPKNPRFSALGHMLDEDGNTRIYFWDKNRTQRIFRLGWSDMPDFYAGTDVQGSLITTTRAYNGTDWDATRAYPLIDFVYWGTGSQYDIDANGDPQVVSPIHNPTTNNTNTPPKNGYTWYYWISRPMGDPAPDYLVDMRVLPGDELHTDNVSTAMQMKSKSFTNFDGDTNYYAAVSPYNPGEYIYRKGGSSHYNGGFQNSLYLVQAGDIRLTPVSVYNNGEVRNYPINTVVKLTDWDCAHSWGVSYNPATYDPLNPSIGGRVNLTVHPKFHELFRFVVNFDQTRTPPEHYGRRLRAMDDEVHVENIQTPSDLGLFSADNKVRGWHSYQPGEWIYREGNHPNSSQMTDLLNGVVSIGDYRLSNVNAWVHPNTLKIDQTLGTLNSDVSVYLGGQVEGQTVTRVHGDLLILAEVLWGGCNHPAYNLSVESDVWQGMVPSVTAASLHSPNGDVKVSAQTIQKNTVLDPDGSRFNIPATTFQNVNLKYREYIGVQLWKDDGIDNHLGQNYPNDPNSGKQADKLVAYNLSDDYKAGRVGEEFIGSNNMVYTEKDLGRKLHSFPTDVMFYDTDTQNNQIQGFATYGCGEAIYRDVDGNALVSSGDIRLTQVTITINNNVITYKADTRVSPGDADVAMVLRPFPHHIYAFFDKAWPEKDIPLNWTYDVGEEIYQLTQDWYNTNFTISTTNTYWMMSSLFFDTDQDGLVSIGDIIIFDYNNITPPGYVVGPTYYDLGTAYTTPTNLVMDPVRNVVYVKGISATDSTIVEPHDFRLNRSYNYLPYTRVEASHTDNGHSVMVANLAAIQDTTKRDQILVYHPVFGPIELAVRITPYTVRLENTRLTDVNISDVSYICGSVVGEKLDLWTNENPVYGLSMGKNSNFRYIDWEVFPSASLGLNVKIDRTLKVEQTSQIDVSVDPAPKPGYWEDGNFIPGEKVYVMIRNVEGPGGVKLYETMKVVTAENPVATFQFTPYRGSCPPSGQSAGWKRTISSSRYVLKDYDLRVRIVAVKDEGGVKDPAPQTYYIDSKGNTKAMPIIDPFWRMHDNTNFRAGQANGNVAWNPPAYNVPTFPEELMNTFDCFDQKRYEVAPEDLEFISSKKCMQVLDQRFPNLQLTLVDDDNLHDVNDPAGMRLSVPTGEEVAVMYDATGAGIDYMFTGWLKGRVTGHVYGDTSKAPISVEGTEENPIRVIVQVHTDGTYLFWHWEDIGDHEGMLDSGDNLYTPYTLSPTGRTPGYIYVRERPNFNDNDCSIGTANCNFGGTGFKQLNYITRNDKFGAFEVLTLGVPTYMMNYGERSATDDGGEIQVAVLPRDAASKLKVRVYTYNLTFDYNSTIQHPPYFIVDERPADPDMFNDDLHRLNSFYTMGVDYVGVKEYKVLPPDPYVNFAELSIVDHALQNSRVNYTAGANPTSRLNVPTPQIQAPYNPLILDVGRDFRGYPGGQTHTGRVQGSVTASGVTRSTQDHSGWNAYPAIWWWFWYNNVNLNNFTDFNKLGTEFFPLTDYGFYFIVKDMDGRHLTFDQTAPIDYRIRRMVISGEFAQPKVFDTVRNKVQAEYEYNGLRHVPIAYDWTGEIIIDAANANEYEHAWGTNWVNVDRDGGLYDVTNEYLADSRRLDYRGLQNVFRFEEIIPIGHGIVNIQVTLWDGTLKIFQDCCAEPPTDGVDIHALTVEADVNVVTADQDNKVAVTVTEYEPMQAVQAANDAFVYVWQDRGVLNPRTKLYDGAGDGWVTNPPTSSDFSGLAPQFFREDDLNNDGKISFADYETEIIGTYDMATNTWAGGVIDARTFQRNNGQYIFDLSATNGAMVTTTGLDFGGRKGDPDHVISEFETLPVMITAYKYGDDNNDRSFRPLYNFGNNVPQYSHEVYLAGQKFIEVAP